MATGEKQRIQQGGIKDALLQVVITGQLVFIWFLLLSQVRYDTSAHIRGLQQVQCAVVVAIPDLERLLWAFLPPVLNLSRLGRSNERTAVAQMDSHSARLKTNPPNGG